MTPRHDGPHGAIVVGHESGDVLPSGLAALSREGVPAIVVDIASRNASVAAAETAGATVLRDEGYGRAAKRGVDAAQTDEVLIQRPNEPGRPEDRV